MDSSQRKTNSARLNSACISRNKQKFMLPSSSTATVRHKDDFYREIDKQINEYQHLKPQGVRDTLCSIEGMNHRAS
jgi:hypothetical protein